MQTAVPVADLGFLFIGGMHQALHIAPVAVALARRGIAVSAYVAPENAQALGMLFARLDSAAARRIAVTPMEPPRWARIVRRLTGATKPVALLAWRQRLLRHDALIAADRTSTLLKRLPGRRPVMIHLPHGSGDRAIGFEPRIGLFDHVLVSGEARRDRLVAEGTVEPAAISVVGAIKLSALLDTPEPTRLFGNDRPIVLYNPHFDARLSSWPIAHAAVNAVLADGRFNLILAPHARLAARIPPAERASLEALGARSDCHVDFASPALSDMTYTRMADMYLGDVSSQVYEFLYRPRPVVFINAHGVAWHNDPDYRMWALGDVVETPAAVMDALARATERHEAYRPAQIDFAAASLGRVDAGVPDAAADALLASLQIIGPPPKR